MKFYVLRGHPVDVYFGDKHKGEWSNIGPLHFVLCLLKDEEVMIETSSMMIMRLFKLLRTDAGAVFIAAGGAVAIYASLFIGLFIFWR